ncbi:uncharacterized protein LOC121385176 isoform X3 [Gigantopelta aegis]|uniref:uncharacterized protein LOC121385176 isoform X3 n=1 Tax=Gigantopelta aegis TaxID=1735272 RepID=UPI001B88AC23|nr:uncharacterized protein LOC121385176 isoform X3 [Gigantopelta aegis]
MDVANGVILSMCSVLLLVTVLVLQPIAGLSEEKPVDSVLEPPELPEQWREFDSEHTDLDYGSTDMKPDSKKKKYPVKPPAMSQEVDKDEAGVNMQMTKHEELLVEMAAPRPRVNRISAHPRVNQIATTTTTTKRPETIEHIFKLPVKTQAILLICLSASASLILLGFIILEVRAAFYMHRNLMLTTVTFRTLVSAS